MDRVDVLEKVKKLLLLPTMEMATTQQVADFYEVDSQAIRSMVFDHREELVSDGLTTLKGREIKESLGNSSEKHLKMTNCLGGFFVKYGDIQIRVNNGFTTMFPKRAILRVGMLLRDSAVAKEVRTQLLNIVEKAPDEVKVADITEEQTLMMAVGMAMANGDLAGLAEANTKLMSFKNRHITKLETENKLLSQELVGYCKMYKKELNY